MLLVLPLVAGVMEAGRRLLETTAGDERWKCPAVIGLMGLTSTAFNLSPMPFGISHGRYHRTDIYVLYYIKAYQRAPALILAVGCLLIIPWRSGAQYEVVIMIVPLSLLLSSQVSLPPARYVSRNHAATAMCCNTLCRSVSIIHEYSRCVTYWVCIHDQVEPSKLIHIQMPCVCFGRVPASYLTNCLNIARQHAILKVLGMEEKLLLASDIPAMKKAETLYQPSFD